MGLEAVLVTLPCLCAVLVSATAVRSFCTTVSKIGASFPPRVVKTPASRLAYSHSLSLLFPKLTPRPGLPPPVISGDWPARQHGYVVKIKTLIEVMAVVDWLSVGSPLSL